MSAKDGLNFKEYKTVHIGEAEYQYRHDRFMKSLNFGALSEKEQQKKVRLNERAQCIAKCFADGLHGYEYYKRSGTGTNELDEVIKRYSAIPDESWIASEGVSIEEDKAATFSRLSKIAPPEFMSSHVTAAHKKSLSYDEKKRLKHQLKDYKIMRAKWEASEEGQAWVNEIKRLKNMEA